MRRLTVIITLLLGVASSGFGASAFQQDFTNRYVQLGVDMLSTPCEIVPVKDFVYQKDLATFTFTSGTFYLLRPVMGRTTTAIFIGQGSALIPVPIEVEQQTLKYACGDTAVSDKFEVCLIRMADNFDERVKAAGPVTQGTLGWTEYNHMKKLKGEYFFEPSLFHEHDNYFQLLRSLYERSDDGMFFVDFNRFTFMFDPNRPQQVIVGYEKEGGDQVTFDAAVLQRQSRNITNSAQTSDIQYPTEIVDHTGTLRLGGSDGREMEGGDVTTHLVLHADSTRFVTLFLHYNLHIDSLWLDGQPGEYHRRKEFTAVGLLLPEYKKKGDTLTVRLKYSGKNYRNPLPYVENPSAAAVSLTLDTPKDFGYLAPGLSEGTPQGNRIIYTLQPEGAFREFFLQPYNRKMTATELPAENGTTLNVYKSPDITKTTYQCFIADDLYQKSVVGAFDFHAARLGAPSAFQVDVLPVLEMYPAMPGVVVVPQVWCATLGTGGIELPPGRQMAKLWFGGQMLPASDREFWWQDAIPEYLGMMYVQAALGSGPFYSELVWRRDRLDSVLERNHDRPLASGYYRVTDSLRVYKGAWLLHMLRFMMFDLEKQSDATFLKFLRELAVVTTYKPFTNGDIIALAEKHYGQPLDWFFRQFLFGRNMPKYKGSYAVIPQENAWMIKLDLTAERANADFAMPILIRVETQSGTSQYFRQTVAGAGGSYELGPFTEKPKTIEFNEFFSVLAQADINKK